MTIPNNIICKDEKLIIKYQSSLSKGCSIKTPSERAEETIERAIEIAW